MSGAHRSVVCAQNWLEGDGLDHKRHRSLSVRSHSRHYCRMANEPNAPPLFRRFQAPNLEELQREIDDDLSKLAVARQMHDMKAELLISNRVGTGLYIAGDEARAAPILEQAVEIARILGDQEAEIFGLFNLATAKQYLGERRLAQSLFSEELTLSSKTGIDKFDHFILHHRGRCFVEQGDVTSGRQCFRQALALRKQLGDPRVKSSQAALDDLDASDPSHRY